MSTLHINGQDRQVDADPSTPILWALRDTLGMTGTKFGCGAALCGACTVLLNGQAIRSCVTPISAAAGQKITTIEAVTGGADKVVVAARSDLQYPGRGNRRGYRGKIIGINAPFWVPFLPKGGTTALIHCEIHPQSWVNGFLLYDLRFIGQALRIGAPF